MAAIIALPLCLAFGVASGLGAAAGLYGAIACGILAAVFGGTPGQCSGPTGPMTVVAAGLFAANHRPELVTAAVICAGAIQLVLGKLKSGQLIYYIPYPVISGFMTGIGAIIICLQLGPFAGIKGAGNVLAALETLPSILKDYNLHALAIGFSSLLCIVLLPRLWRRLPASLIALVGATLVCEMSGWNVPRIGEIPSGLPVPHLPEVDFLDLHPVIQGGLTLALLGSIDSLLTSLVLDKVTNGRHDSNQELIGQGIGNMASGLIGGLPGAGATMRSMVNVKSGGRTYLSGMLHGSFLLAVLLGLGPIAGRIPLSVLAAILISVGISIMDWRVLKRLKTLPRSDLVVMVVVLALTVFVDLIIAVLVGVALASVLFVKQFADARTSAVGDLETLEELRAMTEHVPETIRKSIYTYQFNGPLFFGEAKNLSDAVEALTDAKYVILEFYNVPLIDQTGAYSLEDAIDKWEAKGVKVLFIGMRPHIERILEDTGAIHKIEIENRFDRIEDAIEAIDSFEARKQEMEARIDKSNMTNAPPPNAGGKGSKTNHGNDANQ